MKLKKADLWLVFGVLAAALLSLLILYARPAPAAAQVVVEIDGKETARYDLQTDRTETIETPYGKNVLVIENGSARIASANCPDELCRRHYAIARTQESIICLPHRLVVRIAAGEAGAIDALAQ